MSTTDQTKYKLCYFVPPSSLQATKTAIFATNLAGQFIPGPDSTPDIGTRGKLEVLEEVRVEMQVLGRENVKKVVEVLKKAHPYEVPVYEIYKMEDF
ncbi:unnamed protein product, partial [Aureobasidium mustum]